MHSALGGGFGSGFKVAGGYDYTGDDIDHPKPDLDPTDCDGKANATSCLGAVDSRSLLSTFLGHGTHVAGIIGALPGKGFFNLTGVAYESELRAYKIGGCEGSFPDDGQSF